MDRGDCLGDETLTEYLEGALDPAMRTLAEAHLLVCDHCRENLAVFMSV
jgi:anti-sigma factor ChrR (cupin superfamily)